METVPLVVWFFAGCGPSAPGEGDTTAPACGSSFFADADGDGHGDPSSTVTGCIAPTGFSADGDDCDDTNPEVHPRADETCNGLDDDCDGSIDVGATDETSWYRDADGDGFGAAGAVSCAAPVGYVAEDGDCDDAAAAVRPNAIEICDGVDDDCDELVDDQDPDLADAASWYADGDNDGYGDPAATVASCTQPTGMVQDASDCNDAAVEAHPGGTEVCDGIDDDCDGLVDDDDPDVVGQQTFWIDADGDGFGDPRLDLDACLLEKGLAENDYDCDDADPEVGVAGAYYDDVDGDGYGAWVLHRACTPDADDVVVDGDCSPRDDAIHPDASELCNDFDDNCDALIDEDDPLLENATLYLDGDGDGYGDVARAKVSCEPLSGYVAGSGDCDDAAPELHPGALEYCDTIDNDCDGTVDDAVVYVDWYADTDGDGYGDAASTTSDCAQPSGYVSAAGDCDDGDAAFSPEASEVCDNDRDEDCDGRMDNCQMAFEHADLVVEGDVPNGGLGGWSLAVADMDADGTADLLSGASLSANAAAYVTWGPATGVVSVRDCTAVESGARSRMGYALDGGDADGDLADDALILETGASSAYLFSGPFVGDLDATDADATFVGAEASLGYDVDLAGDVDGDGSRDVVIGDLWAGDGGSVYVASGDSSGTVPLSADATYVIAGAYGDSMGFSNADLGDVNGDGISDLALGANGGGSGGSVYVVAGGAPSGMYDAEGVANATITSAVANARFGVQLIGADYDLDGAMDLFVGAPDDPAGGVAYGFLGPLSGSMSSTDADVLWQADAGLGSGLAAGDADGDKHTDLAFGGTTSVYLQLGLASGVIDVTTLLSLPTMTTSDHTFGGATVFVPDWDGDDAEELAVGSVGAVNTAGRVAGAVHVYFSEHFY